MLQKKYKFVLKNLSPQHSSKYVICRWLTMSDEKPNVRRKMQNGHLRNGHTLFMEYKNEPQTGVSSCRCSFDRRCYLLGFGVDRASTIHGSDFEPSLNSSFVNLPSLFTSICANIFSTRFCGVSSSSGRSIRFPTML